MSMNFDDSLYRISAPQQPSTKHHIILSTKHYDQTFISLSSIYSQPPRTPHHHLYPASLDAAAGLHLS